MARGLGGTLDGPRGSRDTCSPGVPLERAVVRRPFAVRRRGREHKASARTYRSWPTSVSMLTGTDRRCLLRRKASSSVPAIVTRAVVTVAPRPRSFSASSLATGPGMRRTDCPIHTTPGHADRKRPRRPGHVVGEEDRRLAPISGRVGFYHAFIYDEAIL